MRRMMRTRSAAVRSQVEYDPHKPNADILDKWLAYGHQIDVQVQVGMFPNLRFPGIYALHLHQTIQIAVLENPFWKSGKNPNEIVQRRGIRPSLGFHTKLKTFLGRFWLFLGFWTSTSTIKNPVTHFIYLYIICLWVLFWQSNIQWHLDPGRTWGTMSRGLPQAVSWLVSAHWRHWRTRSREEVRHHFWRSVLWGSLKDLALWCYIFAPMMILPFNRYWNTMRIYWEKKAPDGFEAFNL